MPDQTGGDETASGVRLPARRVPIAPVPVAVRTAGSGAPRRRWLPVGTLQAGVLAEVDPGGLVAPIGLGWSLDWWVGAEDRWHHPTMERSTRQGPLGDSAVVVTHLRVPGGEVHHRVGGAQVSGGLWAGPATVVEVENASAVPVALALVVRPWRLDGEGPVREVAVDGTQVLVDGRPAMVLSRPPARMAHGGRGEVAAALARGDDAAPGGVVARPGADLEVALVLPLAHTAVARVALLPAGVAGGSAGAAAGAGRRARRRTGRGRASPTATTGAAGPAGGAAWDAPDLSAVAKGWEQHAAGDPTVEVPLAAWPELVAWAGSMVRLAGPGEVTRALDPTAARPEGPPAGVRVAAVAESLAGLGDAEVHDAVAAALAGAQRRRGEVRLADRSDGSVALLWSAGAVLAGGRGARRADELVGPVLAVLRHMARSGSGPVAPGRAAAALRHVAVGLAAVGHPEVAEVALDLAGDPGGRWVGEAGPAGPEGAGTPFGRALGTRDLVVAGDPDGLERLGARLGERGAPGSGDLGFDVAELAETRAAALAALVTDGSTGPVLVPVWARGWNGQFVEAHRVPTAWGRVGFAVRWHGGRPALLWEVERSAGTLDTGAGAGVGPGVVPEVRAPGLDPGWAGRGWSGEALLGEVAEVVDPDATSTPPVRKLKGQSAAGPAPQDRPARQGPPPDEAASFS